MRFALSLTVLLMLSASLSAQSNSDTWKPAVTSQGCPISFAVKRPAGLVSRSVDRVRGAASGEGLDLSFAPRTMPDIASATVTVHGFSAFGRVAPTEVSQTFHLARNAGSSNLSTSEVWTKEIVFVRWAEVADLQYSDGTSWHPSAESHCQAYPGLLLLTGL